MDGIKKVTTKSLHKALLWTILLIAGVPMIIFGAISGAHGHVWGWIMMAAGILFTLTGLVFVPLSWVWYAQKKRLCRLAIIISGMTDTTIDIIGDTAGTVEVGSRSYPELVEISKTARNTVAEFIGEGVPLCEIGSAVERTIRGAGFAPIVNLCGHQIARNELHAGFSVPNYDNGDDFKIQSGMTVAIEPFATNGKGEIKNGKPGNIVRIIRERPLADPKDQEFYEYIKEEFFQQPFCARSCEFPDAEKRVRSLIRHGVLSCYAELVEVSGGLVSQHEYTFYIDGKHGEVTTLP